MDLVFFGIQGCGKGTQAKKLVEEFKYTFFEAGGELRKIAEENSHLGDKVRSYINAGHLVPHDIIIQVVFNAIQSCPEGEKMLFDGIPRDEDQMTDFDRIMKEQGREFKCINIVLDEEVSFKRILSRAEKEERVDDSDEKKIRRRMRIFHEETSPVIETYRKQKKVIDVDGTGKVEEVYEKVKKALDLGKKKK
jgi:adenylate kinase